MTKDYLEVDSPIPGQNYVCLSFISPDKVLKEKELFIFNKFMNQKCGEIETRLDTITKEKTGVSALSELKKITQEHLKFSLEEFDSKFKDFKYKFSEDLDKLFKKKYGFQTSVRGIKIRGVYDSPQEAERRAKELQIKDRSFHVFVGQIGYWLPWDPEADKIKDEEYLEEGLNNLMKEYKKNEVSRDLLYDEQKRDKMKKDMEDQIKEEHDKLTDVTGASDALEAEDPWMKSTFNNDSSEAVADSSEAVADSSEAVAEKVI